MTKKCRYQCGKIIEYRGKEGRNSTGLYEIGTNIEHTFKQCAKILKSQGLSAEEIKARFENY